MNEQNLQNALITAPVQAQERIATLDIIRGVALLGILLVHMPLMFGTPFFYKAMLEIPMEWATVWDRIAESFVHVFVIGKFYPIFSFLFGLGFYMFYERAKMRSTKPTRLFSKRLFILLIIGLVHMFFIWFGDVLFTYAVLGFLLPLFFNRKPTTILIWAGVLFVPVMLIMLLLAAGLILMGLLGSDIPETGGGWLATFAQNNLESSVHAYGSGTFGEIMAQRATDALLNLANTLGGIFTIFPIFLVGLYVGKIGLFQNIEAKLSVLKKMWLWSLIVSLPTVVMLWIIRSMPIDAFTIGSTLIVGFFVTTSLVIFYITSIILLCQNKKWLPRLQPFGHVGRMALTNYLLQSIIATMIFYSYGLGLYNQIAPGVGMLLALLIFVVQIVISKWWLERYQFGPMEWVWKSLTYGKRFGMRK